MERMLHGDDFRLLEFRVILHVQVASSPEADSHLISLQGD